MDTTKNMFSNVLCKSRCDGAVTELSYDDVIRVIAPAEADAGQSSGYLLKGQSVLGLSCTNPNCVSGTPPIVLPPPISIGIEMNAEVELASGGKSLLITANGSQILVPILDACVGAGAPAGIGHHAAHHALCTALAAYRDHEQRCEDTDYHVYWITDTPSALSQLQHKWIALPVPCAGCPAQALRVAS
jgi:hypothetical protein